jgi:hypothetical protein
MPRKSSPPVCLVLGLALAALAASTASAQQPKLDLMFHAGGGLVTFVPREEGNRKPVAHAHFQVAFGARYRHRQLMVATAFGFRFWNAFVFTREFVEELEIDPELIDAKLIGYSFELPMLLGYIPYKNPYFKLFLYGGLVNQFNLRFRISRRDHRNAKLSPMDLEFPIYQALCRLGVSFDVTLFNFDVNYSVGLNSATQTDTRTNVHIFSGSLGMLF